MKRRMPFTGKSVELWSFHTVAAAALYTNRQRNIRLGNNSYFLRVT